MNVSWVKDLGGKFTRREDLVEDFCADICPTPRVCILRDQHKEFVRCNLDLEVLSAAEPDFVLVVALQVLNPNSKIEREKQVGAEARAFKGKVAVVSARRRATVWEMSPVLDAKQMTPGDSLQFFYMLSDDYERYQKCRHTPLGI